MIQFHHQTLKLNQAFLFSLKNIIGNLINIQKYKQDRFCDTGLQIITRPLATVSNASNFIRW